MSGLRFLNKGFAKNKFKRVSEYCFNLHNDDKDGNKNASLEKTLLYSQSASCNSNISGIAKASLLTSVCNAGTVSVLSDGMIEHKQQKLSLSAQLEPFAKAVRPLHTSCDVSMLQPNTPLNSNSNTTHHQPCYIFIKTQSANVSTSNSDNNRSSNDKNNEGSVLHSIGIDRKSDNTSKESKRDQSNENEGKQSEEDNKETPFLRSQRYAKWMLLATVGIGTPLFIMQHGSPKYDEFGDEIKDQYSDSTLLIAYIRRAWGEINLIKREIIEPSSKKLLPDPLKEPYYQPPYTLVIELMDVFLRPVYDSVTGWRFKKRPGIDYFLSQVGPPLFEVVIFTRETGMTAFPLIDSMDQKGYIMYRLFRDAARYKSGFSLGNPLQGEMPKLDPYYQKDLTYLNRDLSKVIMIDCDKRSFERQPENGLTLEKWDGSSSDTTLYDLAGLLRAIATSNVEDVRPVLQHYAATEKPIETFKLAQAKYEDSRYAPKIAPSSSLLAGAGSTVSSFIRKR